VVTPRNLDGRGGLRLRRSHFGRSVRGNSTPIGTTLTLAAVTTATAFRQRLESSDLQIALDLSVILHARANGAGVDFGRPSRAIEREAYGTLGRRRASKPDGLQSSNIQPRMGRVTQMHSWVFVNESPNHPSNVSARPIPQ